MEKKVLAVGDSTRLEIVYSSGSARTRITKLPRISTNEGSNDKRVKIIAQVTPRPDSTYPIVIKDYKLDLSQFTEKTIDKRSFEIINVSDQKVNLKMVSCAERFFDVKLPKSIKPGKTAKGEVKLRKDVLDKSFEKSFTIELDDENATRFTIPVKRTVRNIAQKGTSSTKGK